MDGREIEPGHHALDHEAVGDGADEVDEGVRVAGTHRSFGDALAYAVRGGAAVRLEDAIADVDDLGHSLAARRDRLAQEDDPRLAAVVERVDRAELREQAIDGVLVLFDAGEHEHRLLGEQRFERGLDDLGARREVVEQGRALHAEGLGEAAHRDVEPLALEDLDRLPGQIEPLLGFRRTRHFLTGCQITFT